MITAVSRSNLASSTKRTPYCSVNVSNAKCASQISFRSKDDEYLFKAMGTGIDALQAASNSPAASALGTLTDTVSGSVEVAKAVVNGASAKEAMAVGVNKLAVNMRKGAVVAGATKLGAALGSFVPGIGNLIGAGVGFVAGSVLSRKIK